MLESEALQVDADINMTAALKRLGLDVTMFHAAIKQEARLIGVCHRDQPVGVARVAFRLARDCGLHETTRYSAGNASRCPAMSNDNRLRLLQGEPTAWPLICASIRCASISSSFQRFAE
jgi:hypothetical protein